MSNLANLVASLDGIPTPTPQQYADVPKARIQAEVYRAADGLRWRIRSSARGKRIIADSGQGYSRKADVFRSLLLVTGGRYVRTFRLYPDYYGDAFEQGSILRRTPEGPVEDIFVQYSSGGDA